MKLIGKGLLFVALAGGTAAAGPFVNIQRFDSGSRAGADLTYLDYDSNNTDVTLLKFDVHAQYFSAESHAGGYLQLPIGYASGDGESFTQLGNIEIGGIYIPQLTPIDFELVLHGGITLPTASDDLEKALVGSLSGVLRVHDLYQFTPKGTTLRLGASPTFRSGKLYARLDAGVDINIDNAGDQRSDTAVHLNAGVGIWATPTVAITGELSSLTVFDDVDGDDDNLAVGAVGARFNLGSVSPYLGIMVPLDDDISDLINLGVMVGADARL